MVTHILNSFARTITGFSRHRAARNSGFALVVTVSLLVLLSVIALGFLSLSAVTLRGSNADAAQSAARANARVALMLAIGELQKHAGPDTRVTAPASILNGDSASSSDELAVTGVWKSWEGSDHTTTGAAAARPIAPDYASKRQSTSSSSGRFLSWLVSMPHEIDSSSLISNAPGWTVADALQDVVRNTPSTGFVPLVAEGSLAAGDPREIHVKPVEVDNGPGKRGAYAWWVSGENQKARLPVPYKPTDNNDVAGWSILTKSHSVADPSALELDVLLAEDGAAKASKAITLNTSSLLPKVANAPDPAKQFHDMSTSSVGLLTNTATGGWRKDLSLFTENWNLLPASGVEVFRITPDAAATATAKMTRPTVATCALATTAGSAFYTEKSVFYPWSTYRLQLGHGAGGNPPSRNMSTHGSNHAAVVSWHNLMDYATLYKKLTFPGGRPTISSICDGHYYRWVTSYEQGLFDYLHKVRIMPLFGRLQLVYSYRSVPSTTSPGKYKVQIGRTPLGTMWNPYNVDLTLLGQWNHFPRALPPAFRFRIGSNYSENYWSYFGLFGIGVPNTDNNGRTNAGIPEEWKALQLTNGTSGSVGVRVPNGMPLVAGETKLFNKDGAQGYDPALLSTFTHYANIDINIGTTAAPNYVSDFDAADQISLTTRFDSRCWPATWATNVGAHYEMRETRFPTLQGDANWPIFGVGHTTYPTATASQLWPRKNEIDLPRHPVGAMTGNGVPFLSLLFGPRLSSGGGLPMKGFQQTSPLTMVNFIGQNFEMGIDGAGNGSHSPQRMSDQGARGARNPVNAPSDFGFITHTSWNAVDNLPNCSQDGKNNGYLISGTQSGDGLKRVVVAELPLRPLGSLAELQHWDLRKDNPSPPRQFNIIANSDAQPLFAPDAVVRNGVGIPHAAPNPSIDLQHDDSYCANHILFDDWFFSTIAPQPTTFGPTGKTLQETFTAFVRDGAPLDNRAYRPIAEDLGISTAQAADRFSAKVNTADAYRTIASRLEVDGMFNVNSTSVKAWRALLGHARNQRMPYFNNNGNMVLSAEPGAADPAGFPVSRTTVASDVAAGDNGSSGSFAGASEYSGYRVFTDEMLDQMAEEMVKQVRLRGPFLSLSEFVNRKLTNDSSEKGLALAGAVQSALNVLAANTSGSDNPYSFLQAESQNAGKSVLDAQGQDPLVNYAGAGTVPTSGYDKFPEASEGERMYGMPGWPRQADILRPLAPILTARDDTFTIRAYGDARNPDGTIIARATCEAIVRRTRDFVSATEDAADITGPPTAATNQEFGRRFQIVSFRWLNQDEI